MSRVYNFSAGPAVLPLEVLEQAQAEFIDWHGSGMSVMEMSHRGKEFISIAEQAEEDLRSLLAIPKNYKVLFLQGGATAQFSMIPLNLLKGKTQADYLNIGVWSGKAIEEAERYCQVNVVASSESSRFLTIPPQSSWRMNDQAAYFHIAMNETIGGVEFPTPPKVKVPLVADMSSTLLSRPINVNDFGVIYAGAQKNIGPAGLTLVIIREDLMGQAHPATPLIFNYQIQAENGSMYNTPPTYAWYLAGLVFQWLKAQGGLEVMALRNQRKASILYSFLDGSDFYQNPIDPQYRSWMNIPFILRNAHLDDLFLKESKKAELVNLKGHRLIGGMRASLYNAMPEEGVTTLVSFMADFVKQHG